MTKFANFERKNVEQFRTALQADLNLLQEKYGCKFHAGNLKFDSTTVTIAVKAAVIGEGGVVMTQERKNWALYAAMEQLPVDGLDKIITMNGKRYKVVGFDAGRSKFPVVCDKVGHGSGGQTLFTVEGARRALKEVMS